MNTLQPLGAFDRAILAAGGLADYVYGDCAWLAIFEGEPPSIDLLRDRVEQRLDDLPLLRCRLASTGALLRRPSWSRDGRFDLARHVDSMPDDCRGEERWVSYVGEALSSPLPLSGPLWKLEIGRGDDGTFALLLRHHHCLADGQSGFLILRTLLGDGDEVSGTARSMRSESRAGGSHRLRRAAEGSRSLLKTLAGLAAGPPPAKLKAINRPLGPRRTALSVTLPKSLLRAIAEGGHFPNEIYLAVVAGALRRFATRRGLDLSDSRDVQVGVMVDRGGGRDAEVLGNHYSALRVPLDLVAEDPRTRLGTLKAELHAARQSALVDGIHVLIGLARFAPSPVVTAIAWFLSSPRTTINTIASFMAGARSLQFEGRSPVRFRSWTYLSPSHSLSFVCQLAANEMTINVLADPDAIPDWRELQLDLWVAAVELSGNSPVLVDQAAA